ncbi:MAG TPA: tetratricopeptide repeat protein, partial [Blastocatellia bacterium]|nr:tetratricopeptide repeat protein [Blastocatellia bacterium]
MKATSSEAMSMNLHSEEKLIRKYLLGTLAESEEQKIEEEILRNSDFAEQVLLIEDELIEDYARCALGVQEHEQFERYFLTTPRRRQKLALMHGLSKYASTKSKKLAAKQTASSQKPNRLRHLYQPSWKIGIYAVVIALVAVGAWQFFIRNSDVNQGLRALNQAYQAQRPLQSRVTGFSYAPFPDTRGSADEKVDERSRDLSGALLLKAVSEKQNSVTLHALGRYYLLRKEFDKAIQQFEEAVKLSPKIARIRSDLGAALLERGKADKAKGDYAQSGKDLGKSLEELTEALNLDPTLIEALFNRALCKQQLGLESRAEEDWKEYLTKDSKSEWAEEVRQQLKLLEEKRKKVQNNNDQLYADFIAAYKSRDGTKAWEAFREGRSRNGNSITEKLIEEFLAAASNPAQIKSAPQIKLLKFAGELESQNVGDRFTLDLANYYNSVTPSQIQTIIQARNLRKQAIEQYNKTEVDAAYQLYQKVRDEFQKAGDLCEASLAESYIAYCLSQLSRDKESIALSEKLSERYKQRRYK